MKKLEELGVVLESASKILKVGQMISFTTTNN